MGLLTHPCYNLSYARTALWMLSAKYLRMTICPSLSPIHNSFLIGKDPSQKASSANVKSYRELTEKLNSGVETYLGSESICFEEFSTRYSWKYFLIRFLWSLGLCNGSGNDEDK